ncbi:hypothetical protein J5X84_16045 [Streptosporangiaceae bacterium NEAU-GS5]|nr:hypothetical protein [Streptosporangiaceae bacterium NEAU-GS5]
MFPAIGDVFGTLDKRFVSTVWLPVQAFFGCLLVIVFSAYGWTRARTTWTALPAGGQVAAAVGYLVAGTLVAYVVAAQISSLIRLYEGYWPDIRPLGGRVKRVTEALTQRQRDRRDRLVADEQHARVALAYPAGDDRVLPTRFGNIMRSAETHPWQRYRLDGVLFWPRLYACLPEAVVTQIGAARSNMEFMLVVSVCGYAFAGVGTVTALVLGLWWGAAIALAGGLLVGWGGYVSSLSRCLAFGTVVRAVFDVHRFALLDTLKWRRPESWQQERAQWQAIGHLWLHGGPGSAEEARRLGYQPSKPPENKPPED